MAGADGFEPSKCLSNGQVLCQLSHTPAENFMVEVVGFEPTQGPARQFYRLLRLSDFVALPLELSE